MKNIPFERTRTERVSHSGLSDARICSLASKRAGTAKPSLISKLLDEYDVLGAVDLEHEYDLKLVGAVMYAGKSHRQKIKLV